MIQRRTRDYEVSLWSLQDSFIAILKQYGLEFKGQIENGKLNDKDDGTQTFTFTIPMYYYKNGLKILNPSWYSVLSGALLINMRKIKVIFNKDNENRKIYEFLIVKVKLKHSNDNSLYCDVECEGLAFHELGKIGYKISLSSLDFYNDDYDWATNGEWIDGYGNVQTYEPLATLNYWNDKIFGTINNWTYKILMNWDNHSLFKEEKEGVLEDYTTLNDTIIQMKKRLSNKVYEEDFIDAWHLLNDKLSPSHITYAREKARVSIDVHDSNIYNITQSLALTFGVFCKYVYLHDSIGHIINRTVVYYNNFLNEQNGLADITYPYQTNLITRSLDSIDLVTKLYVKSILDDSGTLSIIDVGANKSQEDYILNFDYLYHIGGITKEQYEAVDKYLLKIRKLNEQIIPASAKVIYLQSLLVKLLAELTTIKNSIALDTEQKLNNEALLKAITNGSEVLSVSKEHPQTAVLLKDTGEGVKNTYYVKITQKGVYPLTIKLYRTYRYQNSQLDDEITTGVIQFDEAGEVVKISNIYYDDDLNTSKTVYIIYDYRPKLYYDRIVNMWINKLAEDEARRESLLQEIARIKYGLYGLKVKDVLKGINVANLFDILVLTKYKNLLKEKADVIKEFNALMGPALREGYWQPEDYTDYGDQYNERFTIKLSELEPIPGSTGNSYFKWDDELFEGEQDIYYEYTAAQYKQAYPCIDLSKHPDILKMIVENKLPISFVYEPISSDEDNPFPRKKPTTDNNGLSLLILVPNLYVWDNEGDIGAIKLNIESLPQIYQDFIITDNKLALYDGTLSYDILPSMKREYSYYVWYAKINDGEWFNVTKTLPPLTENNDTNKYICENLSTYLNNIKIKNSMDETKATIQLVSTSNQTMLNWTFRLLAGNQLGTNVEYDLNNNEINNIDSTHIRMLSNNIINYNSNSLQLQTVIKDDANNNLIFSYDVTNEYINDMQTNHYIWQISDTANFQNAITIIDYFEGEESNPHINVNYLNKITINKTRTNNIDTHILQINNPNGNFFTSLFQNISTKYVRLIIKNVNNYLNNSSTIGENFICYGRDTAPWIISNEDLTIISSIEYPSQDTFKFIVCSEVALPILNNNLIAQWQISPDKNNWQDLNTYLNNNNGGNNVIINNAVTTISGTNVQSKATLTLTIATNSNVAVMYNLLNNKYIRGCVGSETNGYSEWYEFINSLGFASPIEIINAQELLSPSIVLLRSEGENSLNYNEKVILIQVNNAFEYNWEIIPAGENVPINLVVNSTTTTVNARNSRYSAEYFSTGTRLIIRIPLIADQNNLQDNGTQIRCTCDNFTGNTKIIPVEGYSILKVTYPLIINSMSSAQWWGIPRELPVKINTVSFNISKAIIGTQNIDTIINNGQLRCIYNNARIELVADNSKYYELDDDNVLLELSNITYQDANENITFSGDICFGLTSINDLIIDGNNVINTANINNDRLYQIKISLLLSYQRDINDVESFIFSELQNSIISVRQNIPEYLNNNHVGSTSTTAPIYNKNNCIIWTYTGTDTVIDPPITIQANDENIFSLNISSVSPNQIIWKCREHDNINTSDNIIAHFTPFLDIISPVLSCTKMKTIYTNIANSPDPGIANSTAVTINKDFYFGLGFNTNLYLYTENPWGCVSSQYFTFIKAT